MLELLAYMHADRTAQIGPTGDLVPFSRT